MCTREEPKIEKSSTYILLHFFHSFVSSIPYFTSLSLPSSTPLIPPLLHLSLHPPLPQSIPSPPFLSTPPFYTPLPSSTPRHPPLSLPFPFPPFPSFFHPSFFLHSPHFIPTFLHLSHPLSIPYSFLPPSHKTAAGVPWQDFLWVLQVELPWLVRPLPPSKMKNKMAELSLAQFPTFDTFHQDGKFLLPTLRKTVFCHFESLLPIAFVVTFLMRWTYCPTKRDDIYCYPLCAVQKPKMSAGHLFQTKKSDVLNPLWRIHVKLTFPFKRSNSLIATLLCNVSWVSAYLKLIEYIHVNN